MYHLDFPFNSSSFQTFNDPQFVVMNMPPPAQVLHENLNFFGYCEEVYIPAGIIQLIKDNMLDSPGLRKLRDYLYESRTGASYFSSGSYQRLERLIMDLIGRKWAADSFGVDMPTNAFTPGDARMNQSAISYIAKMFFIILGFKFHLMTPLKYLENRI